LREASPSDDESPMMYAAPAASKSGPGSFTRSRNKITLSKEEADIARRSGISFREYAKQKLRFLDAKRADPEKYGTRG
jgi:hypothetical protein